MSRHAKASDSCKNFDGEEHRKNLRDAGGGAVMLNHAGICLYHVYNWMGGLLKILKHEVFDQNP